MQSQVSKTSTLQIKTANSQRTTSETLLTRRYSHIHRLKSAKHLHCNLKQGTVRELDLKLSNFK